MKHTKIDNDLPPGTRVTFKPHVRALRSLTGKEKQHENSVLPLGPVIHDREIGVVVSVAESKEHKVVIVNVRDTIGLASVDDVTPASGNVPFVLMTVNYIGVTG